MYCVSIPSLLVGFYLLYFVVKQAKHWFPISIICLQLLCSASFLSLTLMHTADLDNSNHGAFSALFQIFVNFIFIGMSAEFLVAFQFWASTEDYLKSSTASMNVT